MKADFRLSLVISISLVLHIEISIYNIFDLKTNIAPQALMFHIQPALNLMFGLPDFIPIALRYCSLQLMSMWVEKPSSFTHIV